MIYIIHGKDKEDCKRLMKENGLKRNECVCVLLGFENGLEKDTEEYKHIWDKEKGY